jgi:hypothetical protein
MTLLDLEKRVTALDGMMDSTRDQLEREANKENKELRREIAELKRLVSLKEAIDHHGIAIGSTVAVFEFLFGHISSGSDPIKRMLNSATYESIIPSIMDGDESLILDRLPTDYVSLISEGKDMLVMIMEDAESSLVSEEMWNKYAPVVQNWVHETLIPMGFGFKLEEPKMMSYENMLLWVNCPADRNSFFPELFDALELYRKNKATILNELRLAEAEQEVVRSLY